MRMNLVHNKIYKFLTGTFCLVVFSVILFLPEPQEQIQNNFNYKKCMPKNIDDYENFPNLLKYSFTHNTILYFHYVNNGRYSDALKTIDKFEKDDFYPTCYRYQSKRLRFVCKTKMRLFNYVFGPVVNTDELKHTYKANAYYKLGDIEKAREEISLKKEKSSLTDKILFKIYLENKNFDETEKFLETKNEYDKQIFTAELYQAKGEYKNAEKIYTDLIKNMPKRDDIKIDFAAMLMEQKKYSKAIKILKSADENKYFYAVNYNLGVCYNNIGNVQKSKEYFKKVLSKNPDNKILIEYLATGKLKPFNR